MSDDAIKEVEQVAENTESQVTGPLGKLMPPDPSVWNEARKLVSDKSIRVEDLAAVCVQDPIIVIELLRASNALYFSGGRAGITTVKTSIVRLGSDLVSEHLQKIGDRPPIEDPKINSWFEMHRSRCRRVAITATILAQVVSRSLSDDCQTAALFISVGEMLAVYNFQQQYLEIAEDNSSRSAINYQLSTQLRFDVELMGLKYLRKQGIPDSVIFALDRDSRTRITERAVMRPICFAAAELVDAFDRNRWEKLAPGSKLPSKSNLRLLQLDANSYLKVYERSAEFLFSIKLAEQKKSKSTAVKEDTQSGINISSKKIETEEELGFAQDIENLLKQTNTEPKAAPSQPQKPATTIATVDYSVQDPQDQFSLGSSPKRKISKPQSSVKKVEPPKLRTEKGTEIVLGIADMFESAQSSEELLTRLLDRLITEGPFEKSALIVVSRDRQHAIVVAARGPNIGNGQKLNLEDPLSPLAQCFSKVQSFGNKPNQSSPFGSKAFALSPIQADHDTPVALYADCGEQGSLTFEARRIFRTVVEILNQKLPSIPGGIPVELR